MYFDVNFNVFFKLIKVHLLVNEIYIYQNARCNNKNCTYVHFSPVSLLHFNGLCTHTFQVLQNTQISNFIKTSPRGAEIFNADGRTDRQTDMMKLIVAFVILQTRLKISAIYLHSSNIQWSLLYTLLTGWSF